MTVQFQRNTRTIKEIYSDFSTNRLIVDEGYQRKKVWTPQDNIRFIETILLELIVPEIFFWTANVDPESGDTITHIVDGQQRISAITDFIDGNFALSRRSLQNESLKREVGDLFFDSLGPEYKTKLWQYPLPIVSIERSYTKSQIIEIFRRLNLTEYSLNAQERRHSDQENAFGRKCEILAENDFWERIGVFSAADQKRMRDVTYCCTIFILKKDGIIDQSDNTAISRHYDDFAETFDEDNTYENDIVDAMGLIIDLADEATERFISKKAQLYSLFSLFFYTMERNIQLEDSNLRNIRLFIMAYSLFRNEYEIEDKLDNDKIRKAYDEIKRYKLASSEGVNKGTNRTIRFNILKSVALESENTEGYKDLINVLTQDELNR